MYKVGLSTIGNITEEFFKGCDKAGIRLAEMSAPSGKIYEGVDFNEVLSWSKRYSVELWSFHLPFAPFSEIDISNKDLSKQSVAQLTEMIKKASDIGIDKFILHSSGEPIADEERGKRLKIAKESLFSLSEIANKCGGVIAVEDLPRTCLGRNSAEINDLISVSDKLRVCFDTNHLLGEKTVDFIKAVGNKIITTHISDYDFVNERHWLPGEGKIDWQELLSAFKAVEYSGPWLYEMSFTCPKTIYRERDLTCEDFVRNAKEVFNNEKITVFSTPKEDLD